MSDDEFIRKILRFDSARLIDEIESVDAMLDSLDSGEVIRADGYAAPGTGARTPIREVLLRTHHLLAGALEINEGTQEEDVIGHLLYNTGK